MRADATAGRSNGGRSNCRQVCSAGAAAHAAGHRSPTGRSDSAPLHRPLRCQAAVAGTRPLPPPPPKQCGAAAPPVASSAAEPKPAPLPIAAQRWPAAALSRHRCHAACSTATTTVRPIRDTARAGGRHDITRCAATIADHRDSRSSAAGIAGPRDAAPAAQIAPALVSLVAHADGTQRLTMRLDPPELGQVQIRIERPPDAPARVDITVEKPETLTLLLRDQPQLQRALDQAGVPPDGRSVTFHVATPEVGCAQRSDPPAPNAWREYRWPAGQRLRAEHRDSTAIRNNGPAMPWATPIRNSPLSLCRRGCAPDSISRPDLEGTRHDEPRLRHRATEHRCCGQCICRLRRSGRYQRGCVHRQYQP